VTFRLFGTDGIRGTAGEYPLDPRTVRRVGAALVRTLPDGAAGPPRMLIGRDTRESGTWIEGELASGAAGEGAVVSTLGVVPTPAVAYLSRVEDCDVGVVISASHNPFADNGIKVFSGGGQKFTAEVERSVEAAVEDVSWEPASAAPAPVPRGDLAARYVEHLGSVLHQVTLPPDLAITVDCANGATAAIGPDLLRSLGLQTNVIGAAPDGRNINAACGSTHSDAMAREVVRSGSALGVAFDGDGDRAIFADEAGRIVDGDAVLLMCARQLKREGRLPKRAIVATVMSNIGLEMALGALGIDLIRCPVGDKYVMEEMLARGIALGGEQSGHIIFADYLFTGDGLCTALNVLRVMALTGRSLADLASDLVTYPQVLLNVRVRERTDLSTVPAVAAAIARVEERVAGHGRLLVRYSGTEPLLRVMLEGREKDEIRAWAQEIVDVVAEHLGA
jgi:phosphoglucosamine mutase